jgi:hypothetical protein
VPSLEELAQAPERAATLPLATARVLYQRAALVQSLLLGRLLEGSPTPASAPPSTEPQREWLSGEQVAERFGLSLTWLAEHRRELRRAGILAQPSRKTFVYHARRLGRYLEARCERDAT